MLFAVFPVIRKTMQIPSPTHTVGMGPISLYRVALSPRQSETGLSSSISWNLHIERTCSAQPAPAVSRYNNCVNQARGKHFI